MDHLQRCRVASFQEQIWSDSITHLFVFGGTEHLCDDTSFSCGVFASTGGRCVPSHAHSHVQIHPPTNSRDGYWDILMTDLLIGEGQNPHEHHPLGLYVSGSNDLHRTCKEPIPTQVDRTISLFITRQTFLLLKILIVWEFFLNLRIMVVYSISTFNPRYRWK